MPRRTVPARFPAFAARVVERMRHVGLARTAASLSYTTLLGIVPLATVAFTTVARFPVFQGWLAALEGFLLQYMLPDSAAAVVHTYLREFVDKAAGLTGISIAFLFVTAVMLIADVEREINLIWGIRRKRPLARRLVVYALGITVGQVLVGASIWATTSILTESLAAMPLQKRFTDLVFELVPIAFSTLALALMYRTVPARAVPWRHAFAGGVVAAIAFEAAKQGFAFYVTRTPTYHVVYGTLATLPLFLIWIYLCWLIVLAGAAITATLTLPPEDHGPHRQAAAS
jgi:membrane protein